MKKDNQIFDLIEQEKQRQLKGIELIASENFVSEQVMQAMGSVMTNKYAEGYPGKRYYGGCEVVDQSENIAINRLKELFGAEWANVQPHSGAQDDGARGAPAAHQPSHTDNSQPGHTLQPSGERRRGSVQAEGHAAGADNGKRKTENGKRKTGVRKRKGHTEDPRCGGTGCEGRGHPGL